MSPLGRHIQEQMGDYGETATKESEPPKQANETVHTVDETPKPANETVRTLDEPKIDDPPVVNNSSNEA